MKGSWRKDAQRTCPSGITSYVHLPGGRGKNGIAAAALFINGKPFLIANLYLPALAVHSRSGNRRDVKLSLFRRGITAGRGHAGDNAGEKRDYLVGGRTKPELGANPGLWMLFVE